MRLPKRILCLLLDHTWDNGAIYLTCLRCEKTQFPPSGPDGTMATGYQR